LKSFSGSNIGKKIQVQTQIFRFKFRFKLKIFEKMIAANLHNKTKPKGKDDNFERVWIGAAPEFDADMSKPALWAVFQIFSKLASKNAGQMNAGCQRMRSKTGDCLM
jgi:hypothetical protein